ncbi:MAG: hypothetical protein FWF82_04355 [Oscillospiraceae bacterium]|nr:hypothetical protein [Oscillospiraceae bacterium]
MKKVFAGIMSLLLLVTMISCERTDNGQGGDETDTTTVTTASSVQTEGQTAVVTQSDAVKKLIEIEQQIMTVYEECMLISSCFFDEGLTGDDIRKIIQDVSLFSSEVNFEIDNILIGSASLYTMGYDGEFEPTGILIDASRQEALDYHDSNDKTPEVIESIKEYLSGESEIMLMQNVSFHAIMTEEEAGIFSEYIQQHDKTVRISSFSKREIPDTDEFVYSVELMFFIIYLAREPDYDFTSLTDIQIEIMTEEMSGILESFTDYINYARISKLLIDYHPVVEHPRDDDPDGQTGQGGQGESTTDNSGNEVL